MESKIVVDTNVVMSALLSDSRTRELMRDLDAELYAPEHLKQEVEKHRDLMLERSGLDEGELDALVERLFRHLRFVGSEELELHREAAKEAIVEVDPDDVVFVATALSVDAVVWSDGSDLRRQDAVDVVTTPDVVEMTEG